jgi:hypothetical protein
VCGGAIIKICVVLIGRGVLMIILFFEGSSDRGGLVDDFLSLHLEALVLLSVLSDLLNTGCCIFSSISLDILKLPEAPFIILGKSPVTWFIES